MQAKPHPVRPRHADVASVRTGDRSADPAGLSTAVTRPSNVITCFTPGTRITTINGPVAVECLGPGDRILTRDRGFQPLLWRGCRAHIPGPSSRSGLEPPVRIRAGALGPGLPARDLVVSSRHRVLCFDRQLLTPHEDREALVEARALVGRPGIAHIRPACLSYIHLVLDHHEVILSENAWTESFQLGPAALAALRADAERLPATLSHGPARLCLGPCEIAAARA